MVIVRSELQNMKIVVLLLAVLAIVVVTMWLAYHFMYSSWAKRQSKLADAKIRKIMEDVRRYGQAEEAAAKTELEAIKQQILRQESELAAQRHSLQEQSAGVDAELDRLIGSVSDPKIKAQLKRELDSILPPHRK
jgi:hypothetical protein